MRILGGLSVVPGRHRALVVALTATTLVAASAAGTGASAASAAGSVTVSGVVYWDQNDDGVRESGEPGVADIRVHLNAGAGTPSAVTDDDGRYSLSGLTGGGAGALMVETGWFRSQCAKLSCPAGPGADNDFLTKNQFIQYPMASVTQSRTDVDVGLLPDWPGSSSAAPAPQAGVVPANAVDVAARLSWVSSTCSDGTHYICRPGDTYTVNAQLLNQGTTAITGLQAVLALPAGDHLATGNPAVDLSLNVPATSPGITAMSAGPVDGQSQIPMTFTGTLVPGGLVKVTGRLVAGGTVGTPGCVRGSPTAACPTAEPFGAPLMLAVTQIDQTGDPDSFGPGCDAAVDVRLCATGIHDKQVGPDEVDPVGHNVDASVGTDLTYDLTSRVDVLTAVPAGGWQPGQSVTWRMSAYNAGPAMGVSGWTLTMLLPKNSKPAVPTANAMRTCSKGTDASGFPFVQCTGRGPLSPGVTSIAVDVTAVVPAASTAGSVVAVVSYVQPASGQGAETNPLGVAPTSPTVDTTSTPTDNDASTTLTVG